MCLLPQPFFSLYISPHPPPLPPPPPFFSLFPELARCANVSTLPIYLPEPRAASCTLCLPLSPQRCPIGTAFLLPCIPTSLFIPSPPPTSIPSFPALLLHAPAFAIFTLHHSCTTHPLSLSPLSLLSRSRIRALHWSNIMTFPVLSTSSASSFFFY